ncbi:MAG: stage II sporulation protein R [Clostridia bacterium]|nr:stage II sporulation protein R [Clostridia bacterium]
MKKFTVIFFIAALLVSVAFYYADAKTNDITNGVLRLHILANSDLNTDQNIKLKIRDRVIKKYGLTLQNTNTAQQAEELVLNNLTHIKNDVNLWLSEMGADYKADAYISYSDFPTKNYEKIKLPAGNYKALKIVLGEGKGKNWWCVMFPPFCFTDGTIKQVSDKEYEKLKEQIGKGAFELVTDNSGKFLLKFKIVELVNNIIG